MLCLCAVNVSVKLCFCMNVLLFMYSFVRACGLETVNKNPDSGFLLTALRPQAFRIQWILNDHSKRLRCGSSQKPELESPFLWWASIQPTSRCLTHWVRVTHLCVSELTIIGSANGLSPSHYMYQCWNNVNSNLRNKLQWNLKRNSCIFVQENAFEYVVCEIASILSRP